MGALRPLVLLATLLWAWPVHADPVVQWQPYIADASARFSIPGDWIERVMRAESGGLTMLDGHPITSTAGAIGLMQLMPETWAEMRARHGLRADPYEARDNILAGAAYLRAMYDRFGYPGLFAAYNAGPDRYAEHLRTGRPLPDETQAYIAGLAHPSAMGSGPTAVESGTRLFFTVGLARNPAQDTPFTSPNPVADDAERGADTPLSGGLFVPFTAPTGRGR